MTFSNARGARLFSRRWGPTPSAFGSGLPLARVPALSACGRCRARTRETSAVGGGAPTALNEDSLSPPQRGCRVGGPGSSRGPQALRGTPGPWAFFTIHFELEDDFDDDLDEDDDFDDDEGGDGEDSENDDEDADTETWQVSPARPFR